MREILARELYGDGIGDLYMQLKEHEEKVGVPLAVDNLDNLGMELYLHEYYGGKYLPRMDYSPKVKDAPRPVNRIMSYPKMAIDNFGVFAAEYNGDDFSEPFDTGLRCNSHDRAIELAEQFAVAATIYFDNEWVQDVKNAMSYRIGKAKNGNQQIVIVK